MSVGQMGTVWDSGLPHNLKSVALALADHADDDGLCRASVDRLATQTGYSTRQTRRIFLELVDLGYVTVYDSATNPPTYRLQRVALPAAASGAR